MEISTKSDVGTISAILIILNMVFFNNAFVSIGIAVLLAIMAIYFIRKDKEKLKFTPLRITLAVIALLGSVAGGIYILFSHVPTTPPL